MNAQTIIERACSEGLIVTLAESGNIKARGDHEVVIRWQPLLKQHKEEIVNLLRSKGPGEVVQAFRPILPKWCRADCLGLEIIPLPNEGPVTGCVNPFTESWRRLDWMTECPAMVSTAIRPILPSWCDNGCEHFHRQLDARGLGAKLWCCWEIDKSNWYRNRIDTMRCCPLAGERQRSNDDRAGPATGAENKTL